MEKNFSKVKATFSVNGYDLHTFKQIAREERTTPSVLVGQYIHEYIQDKGVEHE